MLYYKNGTGCHTHRRTVSEQMGARVFREPQTYNTVQSYNYNFIKPINYKKNNYICTCLEVRQVACRGISAYLPDKLTLFGHLHEFNINTPELLDEINTNQNETINNFSSVYMDNQYPAT